jgi:hypothetical protein
MGKEVVIFVGKGGFVSALFVGLGGEEVLEILFFGGQVLEIVITFAFFLQKHPQF